MSYERSGKLLNAKFLHFLLPTTLTLVATSLNEFVDSIIVSRLLGNEAMRMVNMGIPVMLAFATIFTLLGVGGSIIYAEYSGKQEASGARHCFSVTMAASVIAAALILVFGIAFVNPLAGLLCRDAALLPAFIPYLRVLVVSGILIIPVQVMITFASAMGVPHIGTAINITANGINLVLDYVFIRFCGTGLSGAAYATATGYLASTAILLWLVAKGKMDFPFSFAEAIDLRQLRDIVFRGAAPAINQLGLCLKIAFCNAQALRLGGDVGASVFALCFQAISMVSILIGGVICTMVPIAASLYGQRDRKGLQLLLRTVILSQLLLDGLLVAFFEAFPQAILHLYHIPAAQTDAAVLGLRIFCLMFIPRGFVLVFMYYFQVIERKLYAVIISILDGFAGIIPLVLLMTAVWGLNGIWMAFPTLSLLMLVGIVCVNRAIVKRSKGKLQGLLLLPKGEPDVATLDTTLQLRRSGIRAYVQGVQAFCERHLSDRKIAGLIPVAVEEMIAYTLEQSDLSEKDSMDILLKLHPQAVEGEKAMVCFRSVGKAFEVSSAPEGDFSNIDVLKKLARTTDFSYVLGMNLTRITV